MIIKTELSESEKKAVKDLYTQSIEIKRNFPNYIHMSSLNEKIWLLIDLFGEEFFKD